LREKLLARLHGILLLGFSYPWFSPGAQMMTLLAFHEDWDSASGRELLALSSDTVQQQERTLDLLMAT
jgi:hypothetical protein